MMTVRSFNTIVFFAVLLLVSWGTFLLFAPFLGAIFAAAILAILFYPHYRRLLAVCGGRARLAAGVMLVVVALTIVLPLLGVSVLLINEASHVLQRLTAHQASLASIAQSVDHVVALVPWVGETVRVSQETLTVLAQKAGTFSVTIAQKTYSGIVGSVINIFVFFFTLFFLFVDGERLMRKLMFLSPLSDAHERLLFESFSAMSRAAIKGTLLIGLIQGSLGALAFVLAGVSNVLLWWVVMVFFAIIPMAGAGVVGFPFALYALLTGDVRAGVILLLAFVVIGVLDNYIRPLLLGHDIRMHTLLIFFATLGGIIAFGLLGFIIGPIIMALFVTLWQIYALEFRQQLEAYNNADAKE